jgi:hypothetical protein
MCEIAYVLLAQLAEHPLNMQTNLQVKGVRFSHGAELPR